MDEAKDKKKIRNVGDMTIRYHTIGPAALLLVYVPRET